MSLADFLNTQSAQPSYTNEQNTSTDMPDWWNTAAQQQIGAASALANTPYQTYQGPRIADFNSTQQDAFSGIQDMAGQTNPYTQQAAGIAGNSNLGHFDQNEFNNYLNPYTGQQMNTLATQAGQNLSENLLPAVNDSFIHAGQFGSSGNLDLTGRALRDTQTQLLQAQGNLLGNEYGQAQNAYQTGQNTQLNAAGALGTLGNNAYNQQSGSLQNELQAGNQQQAQTQGNLTLGYQDFLNQQQYPYAQQNYLNGVLNNYKPPSSTMQYANQPINAPLTNSPAQQLSSQVGQAGGGGGIGDALGGIASIAGLFL